MFFIEIGCYSRKGVNEIKAQIQSSTPNQQNKNIKISDYQPSENLFKKYLDKVNTDPYEGPVLTQEASNKMMESFKKADAMRFNIVIIVYVIILFFKCYIVLLKT